MATNRLLKTINVFKTASEYEDHKGGLGEDEISLVPCKAVVIETWSSGSQWYRKYSDGYVEQGGRLYNEQTVIFPVAFLDIEYSFVVTAICNTWDAGTPTVSEYYASRSQYGTEVSIRWGGFTNYAIAATWEAKGYFK